MNNIKRFKNIAKIAVFMFLAVVGFYACEERDRFAISSDDKTPPASPEFDSVQPLPGGARLFYQIPADRDLISIEASFTAANGKLIKSAVSFVAPYIEVFGFSDTLEHTVQLYALDVAGNKSKSVDVSFYPLEPAYSKVAKALTVKPAFSALIIEWENELQQNITVYVDFTYSDNGAQRSLRQVFSSRKPADKYVIEELNLPETETVGVKVSVEDLYGNRSETIDKGQLHVLADAELDKTQFKIPDPGVIMGDIVMAYGNCFEGRTVNLFDGLFDYSTSAKGNIAFFELSQSPLNVFPWNIFVDLGDHYELSRIRTHQYWTNKNPQDMLPTDRGLFYAWPNVGIYNMYWWDGDDLGKTGEWKLINQAKIEMPTADMSVADVVRRAVAGDEILMYPDNPGYTPTTRYFRYQSWKGFTNNYGNNDGAGLSEITLYGRKAR
ncbi:hypothetical protein FACS189430_06030 [Bacteroidia bacterium]|nr:hypothetical protein FACS189430_06030 [Bacteroidia bacterium]